MGITTQPPQPAACASRPHAGHISPASMSQGYHQSIFSFSDGGGFDRSTSQEQQQQHIAQQSRRDKLRVQGFDAAGNPLVPIDEEGEEPPPGIYDSAPVGASNMLSDLFSFPPAGGPSATELLAGQMSGGGYRLLPRPAAMEGFSGDWYGGRQGIVLGGSGGGGGGGGGSSLSSIGESTSKHHHDGGGAQQHPLMGLNADSAAAMQLFLMNPAQQTPQRRSASPPVPPPQAGPSALHHHAQAFQSFGEAAFGSGGGGGGGGGLGEGKGLSLSLSSSLQQFDMAKADELRVREGVLYFNNQQQQQHPALHLQGHGQGQQVHMSYGAMGVVNVLRNSKYARAAQQLLEEFCSVGRGQSKGSKVGRQRGAGSSNPNPSGGGGASISAAVSSSTSKPDAAPLSSADKFEYQRKKAKLISMLDEVDRRYNHYCDQMQMVVNSFDSVMGFGAAAPYTALAQKAMSRHFRCLKDAIAAQLRQTCELLGDREGASSAGGGITRGETPRLRLIDQSLRQQRAFHQMGMMEQEAWRPQRGLPERSVTILRAWLFEHFLHPYPSDTDKHLLARQTGLSRNQVSNWFINARVRLWKPMVEDMYQQEFKDDDDNNSENAEGSHHQQQQQQQQLSPPPPPPPPPQQQQIHRLADATANAPPDGDPSASSASVVSRHNYHHFASSSEPLPPAVAAAFAHHHGSDDSGILIPGGMAAAADMYRYGPAAAASRLGTAAAAGDVSLTLGLRHAGGNTAEKGQFSVRHAGGNTAEKGQFSVRDFGA